MGVDVDGLAYALQRPMVYGHQMRGENFLSGAALSHCTILGGGTFLGTRSPEPGYLIDY
jgi:hypothetical protein